MYFIMQNSRSLKEDFDLKLPRSCVQTSLWSDCTAKIGHQQHIDICCFKNNFPKKELYKQLVFKPS